MQCAVPGDGTGLPSDTAFLPNSSTAVTDGQDTTHKHTHEHRDVATHTHTHTRTYMHAHRHAHFHIRHTQHIHHACLPARTHSTAAHHVRAVWYTTHSMYTPIRTHTVHTRCAGSTTAHYASKNSYRMSQNFHDQKILQIAGIMWRQKCLHIKCHE